MPGAGRPAVFLDRDGTLIVDRHYLADPAGVELLPRAADALRRLNEAGLFAALVTNQSGIGRGYFGEAEYAAVHARLVDELTARGARLDAEYHCPLGPDDPDPEECRKPKAGMYRRAAREHGLDLASSVYVGDRLRDVTMAQELGGTMLLVCSPESELDRALAHPGIRVVDSLWDAVDAILGESRGKGGGED